MKKTATFVRKLAGYTGDAKLYQCDPPMKEHNEKEHEYVVVSATRAMGRPETYVFPSNRNGSITDWAEMPASQGGVFDHWKILTDAGYEVK